MTTINAYRTKPLSDQQERRLNTTLALFGIGPRTCHVFGSDEKPFQSSAEQLAAMEADGTLHRDHFIDREGWPDDYQSFFSRDEIDDAPHYEIDFYGDADKVPELGQALRFCGFVVGKSAT